MEWGGYTMTIITILGEEVRRFEKIVRSGLPTA